MSNSKTVMKNSFIGLIAQMISMVVSFFSQRYFLRCLGLEVVGINSVIGETLGFLSFAELGVGAAITYRLYKPLVDKDEEHLTQLMSVYRFLYQMIGFVILGAGFILIFFLRFIIKDASLGWSFIYLAYLIQLISTVSTYFFAYKRTLVYADQKQFVCKIVDISCNIVFSVVRIVTLIIYRNFHVYLGLQFLQTLMANMILAGYCNKQYPYVKKKPKQKYQETKALFKDTKDLLFGKIAGYVYSSTDNLVITKFAGLVNAGGFSNYKFVTNSVKNLISGMTDSIVATIGNAIQLKNKDESLEMLQKYQFIRYVVANIAATGLCICTDAFVGFAFGEEYILKFGTLYLIVADIFIGIVYGPLGEYVSVLGYFKEEKYISIVGTIINLVLSIIFVQRLGVPGVLVGTVVAQIFFWISKSILISKKYFQSTKVLAGLWRRYICYIILVAVQIFILMKLKNVLLPNRYDFVAFIIEGILSVFVSLIFISACFFKTREYQYLAGIIKRIVKRK